jgi:hypothetical protein
MLGANKVCFGVCRLWRLTLMIQPCMQREAFAGCIWVKRTRLWMTLLPTKLWGWIYQIPAMSKQQLWYWRRWAAAVSPYSVVYIFLGDSVMCACLGVCPSMPITHVWIEIGLEKRRSGLKLDLRKNLVTTSSLWLSSQYLDWSWQAVFKFVVQMYANTGYMSCR